MLRRTWFGRNRKDARRGQPAKRQAIVGAVRDRAGSTLLVVLVLLGMLSLVGFLFYTFAAAERSTATNFADGNKVYASDSDTLVDFGLAQLILGPRLDMTQSALYGNRHSLLPNLFGRDIHPYNSAGIHLGSNNGLPFLDQNFNNQDDAVEFGLTSAQNPLEFNDTPGAHGWATPRDLTTMPDPGVDYTYPDINNVWLAYKGYAVDVNGNTVQVVIPSFHRPQLLRTTGGAPVADWYTNATMSRRVLRPHSSHLNPDGNPRFPTMIGGTTLTAPFPFAQASSQGAWSLATNYVAGTTVVPNVIFDVDNDNDGIKEGIWMDLQYPVVTLTTGQKVVPLYSFTVYDADGLFNLNVHGNVARQILMSGFVGDIASFTQLLSGSNQGLTPAEVNPQFALSVDPAVASDFTSMPNQYGFQFDPAGTGTPGNLTQTRNMDWYRLLTGTANFSSNVAFSDLYPGRYGEANLVMYPAFQEGVSNGSIAATYMNKMPYPGITGADDNWNQFEGQVAWEFNSGAPGYFQNPTSYFVTYNAGYSPQFYPATYNLFSSYPYGTPLDFKGRGTAVDSTPGTFGKIQRRIQNTNPSFTALLLSSMNYPQYVLYDNGGASTFTSPAPRTTSGTYPAGSGDFTNLGSVAAGWRPDSLLGTQMIDGSGNPYFTGLNQGPIPLTQLDEDVESIAEPTQLNKYDNLFELDEMAFLRMSNTDQTALSITSRLKTLAPLNFKNANPATGRDASIRERFTVLSHDRRQFSYAGTGVHRPWELTDLDGDSIPDTFPPAVYDTTNSVYLRSTNSNLSLVLRAYDPFRAPVRQLLELTVGNTIDFSKKQFRLSLNHLTTTDTYNDYTGNLIQRPLTPHDPSLTSAPASSSSTQEVQARLDRQQMARDIYVMLYMLGGGLDTTGQSGFIGAIGAAGYLGSNAIDASGNRNLYTNRQLREMAQFAVNVVDALDPDHIMTKFEYDKNLGNGWGDVTIPTLLDDDPYSIDFAAYATGDAKYNPDYPEDSDERGVVYGVESQQLTFSEISAFKCPALENPAGTPWDHPSTLHDEKYVRYYTFVELRNIDAETINVSNTANLGHWRIRVVPTGTADKQRRLTLTNTSIAPGAIYTIGNAGESDSVAPHAVVDHDQTPNLSPPDDLNHSRFRADYVNPSTGMHDFTNNAYWIAPNNRKLDLDLITDRALSKFRLTEDPAATPADETDDVDITTGAGEKPGALLNDSTIASATDPVTFILERRQYPDRPEPATTDAAQQADNPWVQVDVVSLTSLKESQLAVSDTTGANVAARLQDLSSTERVEPLRRPTITLATPHHTNAVAPRYNSLMLENSTAAAAFPTWQTTYNRPFASPVELFHIPLYGPQNATKWIHAGTETARAQIAELKAQFDATAPSGVVAQSSLPTAATAVGKFLQPQDYNNQLTDAASKVPANDNRWYRLFEFFEVPTRTHRQLGDPLTIIRTPGKMNVNGFRHPDVLAGFLNDTDVMQLAGLSSSAPYRPYLYGLDPADADPNMPTPPGFAAQTRDWWVQFLQARDGRRTFATGDNDANNNPIVRMFPDNVTALFLPGLADSSPFRSFASAGFVSTATFQSPETALDQTLFRRLPFDMGQQPSGGDPSTDVSFNTRHLWEVGAASDHQTNAVEPAMRDRLLSRIYNNTTTRSHVLTVFMSVQYFEADDTTNGPANVLIGGPVGTGPVYRGFFVIDRSRPEEAYDPATRQFTNFRNLVKYRQRIE